MIAAFGMQSILNHVLFLHGVIAYVVVATLCAGEAAVMFGFICPGETAVILGGVLASQHKVTLWVMGLVVVSAAIVGDSIGFEIGRRFGPWILSRDLLRRRQESIDRAQRFIVRRGSLAVFLGRWTAVFRAFTPGLAGMSNMTYSRFFVANAIGGALWGLTFLMLGFVLGSSVEHLASLATYAVLVTIISVIVTMRVRRHMKERRQREMSDDLVEVELQAQVISEERKTL
jgi:membrane protein DedA with SNARE-associated domain